MNSEFAKLPLEILGLIIDRIEKIRHLIQLRLTCKWMLKIVDLFVPDFELIPQVLRSVDGVPDFDDKVTVYVLKMFYGIEKCFYPLDDIHFQCMETLSLLASRSKRSHEFQFHAHSLTISRLRSLIHCKYRLHSFYGENEEERENIQEYLGELMAILTQPAGNMVKLVILINLNHNLVVPSLAPLIAEALENPNCKLKILRLSSESIDDEGVIALSRALTNANCKLIDLCLSNYHVGFRGMEALFEAISDSDCKLQELTLSDNDDDDEGLQAMSKSMASPNCNLTGLYLVNNYIGDFVLIGIANAICSNAHSRLKNLHMENTGIGHLGAEALSNCLENTNCNLKELYLYDNSIGDKGSIAIVKSLLNSKCKLTYLNLGMNGISTDGAEMIAHFISSTHCKLDELYLGSNNFGDSGAIAIANALSNPNCNLTDVNLENCGIGDEGAKAIAIAISREYCKLNKLNLNFNKMSTEMNERLRRIAETRESTLQIEVGGIIITLDS